MKRLSLLVAVALLGLLVTAPAVQAGTPTSPFNGHWHAIDPVDGSNLDAYISGGKNAAIVYTDDVASNVCGDASSQVFTSFLTGTVDGDQLSTTFRAAKCGTQILDFRGFMFTWTLDGQGNGDPSDDVLTNSFGETYSRVA